jgi:hypothetical protein
VVTDGRRAPMSRAIVRCVRRSGSTIALEVTRPQRSASSHSIVSTRTSTRVRWLMACVTATRSARRSARANRPEVTWGQRRAIAR